jgi:hypothetical protein
LAQDKYLNFEIIKECFDGISELFKENNEDLFQELTSD